MSVIKSSLFHVIKRFPLRKNAIHLLIKTDDGFYTLCEDYRRCSEALTRWHQSTSEEAPLRQEEYSDLLRDLELEIVEYLNEKEPAVISGKGSDHPCKNILSERKKHLTGLGESLEPL